MDLAEAARAAANDAGESQTTPIGPALSPASRSSLREFPEMPTATTTMPGSRARQWTAWILLPLIGAAVAIATLSLQREPNAVAAAIPTPHSEPSMSAASVQVDPPLGGETSRGGDDADTVKWRFNTEPQGAIVVVDGVRQTQRTPMSIVVPRGEAPLVVQFERDGYEPREVQLEPLASNNFFFPLTPEPSNVAAPVKPGIRFVAPKRPKSKTTAVPVSSAPPETKSDPSDDKLPPNPLDAWREGKKDSSGPPQ
jgi:hypothetical protein